MSYRDRRLYVSQRDIFRNVVEFYFYELTREPRQEHIGEVVMRPLAEGADPSSPTFVLPMENAQCLMDDLWRIGLRPSEGAGSAGSLRATERHLEDMRRVVAKLLKVGVEERKP